MSKKKDHILDVAEALFANHGFEGTTTRAISEKAQVNIAMLSYYFGSKEKLLQASLDRYANAVFELLDKIRKEVPEPEERVKKWNIAYLDFAFNNPRPIIISSRERSLLNDRPEILENIENVTMQITNYVYETIEQGKKSGVFKDVDTYLTMHTLGKTIDTLIVEHVWIKRSMKIETQNSDELYPREFVDRIRNHLISLIEEYLIK